MPGKTIDLSEVKDIYTCSAFWGDSKGHTEVTTDIINKIERGDIVITELHQTRVERNTRYGNKRKQI